jgi:hypothetical protein
MFRWLGGSGESQDRDVQRNVPLIGQRSPLGRGIEVPKQAPGRENTAGAWWAGPGWAELAADCPCEDCLAQRLATVN